MSDPEFNWEQHAINLEAERDKLKMANHQLEYCKKALLARRTIEEENAIIAERDQLAAENAALERERGALQAQLAEARAALAQEQP